MIKGWSMRYPVRNGSVVNVLSLPTFTVPRNGTSQTPATAATMEKTEPGDPLASVDVFEASDAPQNTTPALSPPIPLDIPRPQNPQTVELHGSVSVRYQSNAGQVSSDVIVGEPLLRTSLLVVKADGLPIVRQTKVSPSRTRTSFFRTQGSAPLPHPPPVHPIHHPQASDVFMHTMLESNGGMEHQVWVLYDVDGQLTWVVVDSPHHTTRPGNPGFVLSFNIPSVGVPSPTWVRPETARRHGVTPRLYQTLLPIVSPS